MGEDIGVSVVICKWGFRKVPIRTHDSLRSFSESHVCQILYSQETLEYSKKKRKTLLDKGIHACFVFSVILNHLMLNFIQAVESGDLTVN